MPNAALSDAEFISEFEKIGIKPLARKYGISERAVCQRRVRIEKRIGRQITSPNTLTGNTRNNVSHPHRLQLVVRNGMVLIGSDAHYWPGPASTAHRAFVQFCKELKPAAVVMNGDACDFASISRHPPIGWESTPTVADEIDAAKERLHEIEQAAGKVQRVWTLGNHDGRFETYLATRAPQYAKVHGVHLKDNFPLWEPCWSTWINDDVVVKHRFKGGIHATHNNAMWSGKSMVTGHLHSAKVTPLTDYNGTRYGVDSGCLADTSHKAFVDYTEDNPLNWRSGFCVLSFKDGRLLMPELVTLWDDDHVQFRGEVIRV